MVPLVMRNNTTPGNSGHMPTPVEEPHRTFTTTGHQSLVVAYNRTGDPKPASDPLGTLTSRDRFALVVPTKRGSDPASKRAACSDDPLRHRRPGRLPVSCPTLSLSQRSTTAGFGCCSPTRSAARCGWRPDRRVRST